MNTNSAVIICALLTSTCFVVVGAATWASQTEIRWAYPPRSQLKPAAPAQLYFRYYPLAWIAPAAAFAFSVYILRQRPLSKDLLAVFAVSTFGFLAVYATCVVLAFYLMNQNFLA